MQSGSESSSYYETPPQVPARAELSPEYVQDTSQSKKIYSQDTQEKVLKSNLMYQFMNSDKQRPLPNLPENISSASGHNFSKSPNRQSDLDIICDLATRPSIQTNLNARFYGAGRGSRSSSIIKSQKLFQESPKYEKIKFALVTKSTNTSPIIQHQRDELDLELDIEMDRIENELQHINQQLDNFVKYRSRADLFDNSIEDISNRSDITHGGNQRYFVKENDQYIPVVDTLLYDQSSNPLIRKKDTQISRSRSRSPYSLITNRSLLLDLTGSTSTIHTTDPRIYTRKLKPIMIVAIEYEEEVYLIEVYNEDTPSLIAERVLQKLKKPNKSRYQVKYLTQLIENEIVNFNKDLIQQLKIIDKRKLNVKEALSQYFQLRTEQMRQCLNSERIKNNWTNSKQAIGRVIFGLSPEQKITLYVHENDDPYELAFYFILDNDLEKSKVESIAQEIDQVLKTYITSSNRSLNQPSIRLQTQESLEPQLQENNYVFKGNFNCGNGKIVPLFIKQGEDINKCVHKVVLDYQLKYEQYIKILKVLSEAIKRNQINPGSTEL